MKYRNKNTAKRVKRRVKGHSTSGGDRTRAVKASVERVMKVCHG